MSKIIVQSIINRIVPGEKSKALWFKNKSSGEAPIKHLDQYCSGKRTFAGEGVTNDG